jgi:hypothetical protein
VCISRSRIWAKPLPHFEETAIPVAMDADIASEYDQTRALLKDYLVQRRWEGDSTFRGAYLQWSMSWVNAPFRDTEVIHNMRHPITNEIKPHTVAKIASYGEERIYAKEQALIDILREELAQTIAPVLSTCVKQAPRTFNHAMNASFVNTSKVRSPSS